MVACARFDVEIVLGYAAFQPMRPFYLQIARSVDSARVKAAEKKRGKSNIGERAGSFLFIQKLMAFDTSTGMVRSAFYPRLVCRHCFRKKIGHAHQLTTKIPHEGNLTGDESRRDKELRLPVIPGRSATCQGLKTAIKYNGARCQVLSYDSSKQRFTVSVEIGGTKSRLKIKRCNLAGMSVLDLQHDTTLQMRELFKKLQYSGFYESILRLEQKRFSERHFMTNARDKDWLSNVEANGKLTGFTDDSTMFVNTDPRDYHAWRHQRKIELMEVRPIPFANTKAPKLIHHDMTITESYSIRLIQTLLGKFWRKHGKQMKRTWSRKSQFWRRSLVLKMLVYVQYEADDARRRQGTL